MRVCHAMQVCHVFDMYAVTFQMQLSEPNRNISYPSYIYQLISLLYDGLGVAAGWDAERGLIKTFVVCKIYNYFFETFRL